jgi:hypothetical protein
MTANGWLQIVLSLAGRVPRHQATWRIHVPGVRPRADVVGPGDAAGGAHSLPPDGRGRKPRDGLERICAGDDFVQRRFHAFALCAQRVQQWAWLPWNPQKLAGVAPALAFNTAASFTTNTNWQNYVPETTMSYLTQMVGLAYHNWVSAAAGMALAIAFIRGIARREQKTIGNFWVDLVRGTLWVLAPLLFDRGIAVGVAGCSPELEAL